MVVVSLFTKEIPRDELGGLTWPTINDPPLSHGAIGENVERGNDEKTDNGKMQMKGKNWKTNIDLIRGPQPLLMDFHKGNDFICLLD